jgi:hypothetical protein
MRSTCNSVQISASRRRWSILLVAALSVIAATHTIPVYASTRLLGLVYDWANETEYLTTIDPATALALTIGTSIPDCCSMSGASTLGSGVLYFVGTKNSESSQRFFSVNTKTGAVLSSPVIPASFYLDFIEFNPGTGTLLGFIYDIATQTEKLAAIDPATAAATPIGAGVAQCCNVSTAPALDHAGGVIYLMGTKLAESVPRLFAFNIQTGAVVSEPAITDGNILDFIKFDASTSRLLGFIYNDAAQTEKLATLNPATAEITPIGTGVTQCCGVSIAPALDGAGGVIYLMGRKLTESLPRLFGFNTQTGEVLSSPMPSSSIYIDFLGAASGATPFGDVDADGKSDITVWRPSSGVWYSLLSNTPGTYIATQWGLASDTPVPGDYDGDGKMDVGVWRSNTSVWYALRSSAPGTYIATQWGLSSDIPVPSDYDGDGKMDIAVWRRDTGVWYALRSGTPGTYIATQWGLSSDIPVQRDYDGDGKTDIAVFRANTGVWYVLLSGTPGSYIGTQWGLPIDTPVPSDYDGDGKADIAVWRSDTGIWYIRSSKSPSTFTAIQWGMSMDEAVPGDYDGDGKSDVAVWRPGNGVWYVLSSNSPGSYTSTQWGMTGDVPISGTTGTLLAMP